jgi:hypothetical protein
MNLGFVLTNEYIGAVSTDKFGKLATWEIKEDTRKHEDKIDECLSLVLTRPARKKKSGTIRRIGIVTDIVKTALDNPNELDKVTLVRLSSPEGKDCPPLVTDFLSNEILTTKIIAGGRGFDGRIISDVDLKQVEDAYNQTKNVSPSFVVSSPFSILFPEQEEMVRKSLLDLGAKKVWTTADVSSLPSILDRETTAILSAASSVVLEKFYNKIRHSLQQFEIGIDPYFGRNDGTVALGSFVKKFPLDTYWSVEGCSISGIARSSRTRRGLVAGRSAHKLWLGGYSDGAPLLRQIGFVGNMLVHVDNPILADLTDYDHNESTKFICEAFFDLVGTHTIVVTGLEKSKKFPFPVKHAHLSKVAAAFNVATAGVKFRASRCKAKGVNVEEAKKRFESWAKTQFVSMGGVRSSFNLSKVEIIPAYNLPEGSVRLNVIATGKAGQD